MATGKMSNARLSKKKDAEGNPSSAGAASGKPDLHPVTFNCSIHPDAKQVALVGTFNDWNVTADPMSKRNGRFVKTKQLPRGQHQYKFLVDGQWYDDPGAEIQTDNEFGTKNSIVRV